MGTVRDAYLLCHLLAIPVELLLGYLIVFRTDMRARRVFRVHVLALVVSSVLSVAAMLTPDPALHRSIWVLWTAVTLAAPFLTAWFAGAFAGQSLRENRLLQTLGVWWVGLAAVVLTEPFHGLYWASATVLQTPFPHLSVTAGPVRLLGFIYAAAAVGLALYYLVDLYFRTRYRPSTAVLALAVGLAVAFLPFVLSQTGWLFVETYNHVAFGNAIAALSFGTAAFRLDLADIAPVARDRAVEDLPDPFVAVDDEGRIVDFNAAFAELFDDVDETAVGAPLATVAAPLARQGIADGGAGGHAEVVLTHEGRERRFESRSSPLSGPRDERRGTEYLLRDITDLREREEELALLKEVFSRTFRHNIRNELIVIQGNAGLARERTDDQSARDSLDTVLSSADRLLSHTEKARAIETVFESETGVVVEDLGTVVEGVLAGYEDHPGVTFETDLDAVDVYMIEGFEQAIESAVENAVEHNPAPVQVEVATTVGDTVDLRIEDDGSGIAGHERTVIEDGVENPLEHGSGVGLWLIRWYVDESDGELSVGATGDGTRVTMTLQRAD